MPLPLLRRFAVGNLGRALRRRALAAARDRDRRGHRSDARRDIRICDLSDDPAAPGSWAHEPQPADTHIAVDPVLGRVAFPAAPAAGEARLATFHYGSALEVGGGGYDRAASIERIETVVPVEGGDALGPPLASVAGGGAVQILDWRRYAAPATITATTPAPFAADRALTLRSANRTRPLLERGDQLKLAMDPDTTIVLNGLMLAGAPLVIEEAADTAPRDARPPRLHARARAHARHGRRRRTRSARRA